MKARAKHMDEGKRKLVESLASGRACSLPSFQWNQLAEGTDEQHPELEEVPAQGRDGPPQQCITKSWLGVI